MVGGALIKVSGKDVSEINWPKNKFLDTNIKDMPKKQRLALWVSAPILAVTLSFGVIYIKTTILNYFGF